MILCFPDPHPDELLYSICARFSDRVGYPAQITVINELFGKTTSTAIMDLPRNLDHLCAVLPSETYYTFDAIINNHTLLPVYAPFLPIEKLQNLVEEMHLDVGKPGMHLRAGLTPKHIVHPQWLRFCPHCVEEDRSCYGECYWHRVHQVLGVEVCPFHEVYLQNSTVNIRISRQNAFISAEHVIPSFTPSMPTTTDPDREVLLQIARDVTWLLNQSNLESRLEFIHCHYKFLLSNLNLAAYQGNFHIDKLTVAFSTTYSPILLKRFRCEFNESSKENWLVRFLRKPYRSQRPIQHLLLMQFLGYSAEAFFGLPPERKPFGDGPWPCLNAVCQHHRQLNIKKFKLTFSSRADISGRPIGIFACKCGFVYSRLGPDKIPEDLFKISRVKSYGFVWENKLRELCKDATMSEIGMARKLGVSSSTVQRQAYRLGLSYTKSTPNKSKPRDPELEKRLYDLWKDKSMTRQGIAEQLGISVSVVRRIARQLGLTFADSSGRLARLKIEDLPHPQDIRLQEEHKMNMHRQAWLSTMQENLGAGVRALRQMIPQVYRWLWYHDREWLSEHSPKRNRRKEALAFRLDWKNEDTRLAEAVRSSAQSLRNAPGRPVWITVSSIRKAIGKPHRLYLVRLPLTTAVLAEVVETREQWAIRHIYWTVDLYLQEGLCPGRNAFIKRAGVRRIAELSEIKEAIDAALLTLSRTEMNYQNSGQLDSHNQV